MIPSRLSGHIERLARLQLSEGLRGDNMDTKRVVRVARGEYATTKVVIEVGEHILVATDDEAREVACKILELFLIEAGGKVPDTAPAKYVLA